MKDYNGKQEKRYEQRVLVFKCICTLSPDNYVCLWVLTSSENYSARNDAHKRTCKLVVTVTCHTCCLW